MKQFIDLVRIRLGSEGESIRTLLLPIEHEFNRNGPDAAKTYLEAQQQELKERVLSLLEQVEEA